MRRSGEERIGEEREEEGREGQEIKKKESCQVMRRDEMRDEGRK